ncbi:MAG: sulfotransferase domain-containing protein [Fibrobacterota bacterium]
MFRLLMKILPLTETLGGKELFLISSIGKSGSTWVQRIADSHPEILCSGEGKFADMLKGVNSCFSIYNSSLNKTNRLIYGDDYCYNPLDEGYKVPVLQFLMALCILNQKKPVTKQIKLIGDKDTSYVHNIPLWSNVILPEARLVHVIRDIRDAFVSNAFHLKRQGSDLMENREKYKGHLERMTTGWVRMIKETREQFKHNKEMLHELRYEDMQEKPESTVKGLFDFLKVDSSDKIVEKCISENAFSKLSGGRGKGEEDRSSFYRKGISGDWKNHLSEEDAAYITGNAGELMKELGYL